MEELDQFINASLTLCAKINAGSATAVFRCNGFEMKVEIKTK